MNLETLRPRPRPSRSPAIVGLAPRSVFSSVDEGRAIVLACLAARGNTTPTPVIFGRRIIGFVKGEGVFSDGVAFQKVPAQYQMAWSNYNNIIASLGASKRYTRYWGKSATTAGVAANWYDLWPVQGFPGAGAYSGAANTANIYTDASAGSIYLGGNVSPDVKTLTGVMGMAQTINNSQVYLVYDRVLDYHANAYPAAAPRAMTNVNVAARYNGAGLPGLQMTWGTQTAHNATASNITALAYTDNTGAAATMPTTPTIAIVPSGAAPTTTLGSRIVAPMLTGGSTTTFARGPFMPLQQGTTGARAVTSYTTSAANTGTFVLTLVYPLAYIPVVFGFSTSTQPAYIDQIYQIPAMERLYDGAAVSVMNYNFSTPGATQGGFLDVAWG